MSVKCWINSLSNKEYSEGDQPSPQHIEVIQRPDYTYEWDGTQWAQNQAKVITPPPSVDEQLTAIRKAIVKNDKADITAIDAVLSVKKANGTISVQG